MRPDREEVDAGFTLIELLIVLIVLSILAAIVMIATGTVGHDSAKAACGTAGKTVRVAEVGYDAHWKHYTDIDTLVADKYLMEQPSSPDYTITADPVTGAVSGTLTAGGESCYP